MAVGCVLTLGFSSVVYARARNLAHDALAKQLRYHADTLSGLLEIEDGEYEFDVPPEMLESFQQPESGAYLRIVKADGRDLVRSPSLPEGGLPDPPPWSPGAVTFSEVDDAPGGIPCAMIAECFVIRVDGTPSDTGADTEPLERRFTIQVALDRRERDAALAALGRFLAGTGAIAILLTFGGGLLITRLVLDPVRRLTVEAASLSPENDGRRLDPGNVSAELHELAATLNTSYDRLAAALARQREFTSDAGHELRTPVSVLVANAEHLLRRDRDIEEYRAGLRRQHRIARRMQAITENLLTLARADSPGEPIALQPARLDEVVLSVVDDYLPLASERGLVLDCDAPGAVPVHGNLLHLHQLVANLVSNAVKFTPSGGRITVTTEVDGDRAVLAVEDTGPGIPREHRDRLFDRFYRVEEGRHPSEGSGLGLAIVQWIVETHRGTIEVASPESGGARFVVHLPLDGDAAPRATARPETTRSASPTATAVGVVGEGGAA